MLLLATDTSGNYGSIALADCDNDCRVLDIVPLTGGTFSAQLVPQIAALLEKHGFSKNDIGAFAVASGPGSFTGLRVGLAAIKALAEVLQKPIAAISLLEALRESSRSEGKILALLDAGRNETYVGEFADGAGAEKLMNTTECLNSAHGATIVTPDPSIADAARSCGLKVEQVERPRSDSIARLGWRKLRAGKTISPEDLEANYIRRSDAEIFSKGSH